VLGLGHRAIAVISLELTPAVRRGPADATRRASATFPVSRARLEGYAKAIRAAGLQWDSIPVYEAAENSFDEGRAAGEAILRLDPVPTALIAMSDALALGAMDAIRASGLQIPGELSITGFDDIPEAASTSPGLTTVREPHYEKGRRAAELMISLLQGEDISSLVTLPSSLIVRGSTGPVASGS
jgi:DNA-binding LacI/PurR family transcriptional regulator